MHSRRPRSAILALACAVLGGTAAFAAPPGPAPTPTAISKTIEWDAAKDGAPKIYAVGDLTLTLSIGAAAKGATPPPVLTVDSARFGRAVLKGPPGLDTPTASLLVTRLDPQAAGPAVVFGTYTGGAHCCAQIDILDPVGGHWKKVDAGQWDGDFAIKPQKLSGDPVPYVELHDQAFLYAFACYACASAPPEVFTLVGGKWQDVSTSPKYAPVFRRDEAEQRKVCGQGGGGQNGACAIYAADAARMGAFDAAGAFVLQHYDRKDDWTWPTGCKVARGKDDACPAAQQIVYTSYPEALKAFLIERNYIRAQ